MIILSSFVLPVCALAENEASDNLSVNISTQNDPTLDGPDITRVDPPEPINVNSSDNVTPPDNISELDDGPNLTKNCPPIRSRSHSPNSSDDDPWLYVKIYNPDNTGHWVYIYVDGEYKGYVYVSSGGTAYSDSIYVILPWWHTVKIEWYDSDDGNWHSQELTKWTWPLITTEYYFKLEKIVVKGYAYARIYNANDDSHYVYVYVDDAYVGYVYVPAGHTRYSSSYEVDVGYHTMKIKWYDEGNWYEKSRTEYVSKNEYQEYYFYIPPPPKGYVYARIYNANDDSHDAYVYVDDDYKGYVYVPAGSTRDSSHYEVDVGYHTVKVQWYDADDGSWHWSSPVTQYVGSGEHKRYYFTIPLIPPPKGYVYARVYNANDDPHSVYVYVDGSYKGSVYIPIGSTLDSSHYEVDPGYHTVGIEWYDADDGNWHSKSNIQYVSGGEYRQYYFELERIVAQPPIAEVAIATDKDTPRIDEAYTITATVTNLGGDATGTLWLYQNGTLITSKSIDLATGESDQIVHQTSQAKVGTYTYRAKATLTNVAGSSTDEATVTVTIELPPEVKYAPNLWFGSTEELYPCSPFFDDDDISGEDNKNDYYALSFDQKMDNFVVYYHVVDTGDEIVYEYWFYYAYNDWVNKHYHDWETVYVFVDKNTGEVNRVVGSAHEWWMPNNVLENPEKDHTGILIEVGSHASCTDKNDDGAFERDIDVSNIEAWGLQWGTVPSDYPGIKIPVVVGLVYPWNLITVWLAPWDQGERITYSDPVYALKEINDTFISKFGGLERFDDPITPVYLVNPVFGGITMPIPIDGEPPTHPWTRPWYDNPYKIILELGDYVTGTVSGSDTTGAIVVILSEEPYYTFADENGHFLINNAPSGTYDIVVNLEGYAPYKQRFVHSSNTSVGVDGVLYLILESEAFRIEGTVTDAKGDIVANTTMNVYDENGTKLFTTLTDENGQYLVTASAEHVYTVEATIEEEIVTICSVSGEPGDIIDVNVSAVIPATIDIDPDTLNLKSQGRWITCYIEIPDRDVGKINVSSILLNGAVPAESHPTEVGDHDNDDVPNLMVKFDRSEVQKIFSPGEVNITITGEIDGTRFEGNDTIRVIEKGASGSADGHSHSRGGGGKPAIPPGQEKKGEDWVPPGQSKDKGKGRGQGGK